MLQTLYSSRKIVLYDHAGNGARDCSEQMSSEGEVFDLASHKRIW